MDGSRLQGKIQGASRNPEYNIASDQPRFGRLRDGRRVAPLSQLNTHAGRRLAAELPPRPNVYNEQSSSFESKFGASEGSRSGDAGRRQALLDGRKATPGPIQRDDSFHSSGVPIDHRLPDRALLPSQSGRTGVSQLFSMSAGSARRTTTPGRSRYESGVPSSSKECPGCCQSDSPGPDKLSPNVSHVCTTCHRFVSGPQITGLQHDPPRVEPKPSKQPQPQSAKSPPTYPIGPVCPTCISVPSYLYLEFASLLPTCSLCSHMPPILLAHLITSAGELLDLKLPNTPPIKHASKELRDWCLYTTYKAKSSSAVAHRRHLSAPASATRSEKLIAATTSLRRTGAIRRAGTQRTSSSAPGPGQTHPGLIPADLVDFWGTRYTRKFSFTALKGWCSAVGDGGGVEEGRGEESEEKKKEGMRDEHEGEEEGQEQGEGDNENWKKQFEEGEMKHQLGDATFSLPFQSGAEGDDAGSVRTVGSDESLVTEFEYPVAVTRLVAERRKRSNVRRVGKGGYDGGQGREAGRSGGVKPAGGRGRSVASELLKREKAASLARTK
ncbi:hypothetical protein M011DRAFT_35642 [Sporormia fimetaria CBS 119925]|uniref:Uncharacterized protein n=1 Tax=Sporormia fimetaria CBS 119925 TaxID=1340428 RepID=A0A6A6VCE8_9PLEO|nr:hypothetical protein M011DRAFT_35642 [Sporormia fimetaria CBS 119925]